MNRRKTDFLYESPSFLAGVGSVLNIYGQNHRYNTSEQPDEIAIENDWRMIGQDFRDVLDRVEVGAAQEPMDHERKQAA